MPTLSQVFSRIALDDTLLSLHMSRKCTDKFRIAVERKTPTGDINMLLGDFPNWQWRRPGAEFGGTENFFADQDF